MSKTNDKSADGPEPPQQFQFAQKPEELPGWEGFKKFMWNSETSEVMGRTGCSWFKIGAFYTIYYIFLAGYFALMMFIFYQTLPNNEPRWKAESSVIGTNPGMGFRPRPPDNNVETTLIYFRSGPGYDDPQGTGDWKAWTDNLNDYMTQYKEGSKKPKENEKPTISDSKKAEGIICDFGITPGEGQFCKVDASELLTGPCAYDSDYGFKAGTPCILLKLNRIYSWKPEVYENSTDLAAARTEDAPPKQLVDHVKDLESQGDKSVGKMVWISCEGENPADRENMGAINFMPRQGFPIYYYPYENQEGYLSPAVFAHFENPKKGVLISISCKVWAKNTHHNIQDRIGSVHFELMID